MVQLTDELVAALDRRARREGRSRSEVIRVAVELYLAADREREVDRQIVEGYTRMPQGGEFDRDEWGELGELVTGLAAATFEQLADEEREAGLEPW